MNDLFTQAAEEAKKQQAPLAERLRPQGLDEVVGQEKLLGPQGALRVLIEKDRVPSLIFWGPPGSGKTTLAQVIAHHTRSRFWILSAVMAGVKELREIIEEAKREFSFTQKKALVFVDEIHRFNKAQQDALLPHIEDGTITLIGATTENPSFEVIGPLLSRCRVFVLEPLGERAAQILLERGLNTLQVRMEAGAQNFLIEYAQGDARRLLNTLEIAANLTEKNKPIQIEQIEEASQQKTLLYDRSGEEHYNVISAFIKSMRASDADAAVYYLARMFEAGEDPLFLARRMVIFASEDIGLADSHALPLAISAMQAYDFVGRPEGWIPLAHAACYLALAPKSNASYSAYKNARAEVLESGSLPVPLHLRNAPTSLMKNLGYGKDYKYAHTDPEGSKQMKCLPEKIQGMKFLKRE